MFVTLMKKDSAGKVKKSPVKRAGMKKKGNGKKLIQSIERAADILNLFINKKQSLGIAEISQLVSLAKPTVQGIVNTLVAREFLERDAQAGRYRLGRMLFQLGMTYATNLDLVTITRGWTERLCFQFGEPVNCGMLVGNNVVVVLRVEPDNRFMVFPQSGDVIPAHSTCIGKILLAYMEKPKRDEFLKDYQFKPLTGNTITERNRFGDELARVKKLGISFDNEENLKGLAGIGGPIMNRTGVVVAAFAITGDATHIREKREEIIEAIRYTSASISAQLGFQPER